MQNVAAPREGPLLGLYMEGPVIAGRLQRTVAGVDYLKTRADGRAELHFSRPHHARRRQKVALEAGGVAAPEGDSSIFQLREHVSLTSNDPALAGVNTTEVWARRTVDVATGPAHLGAHAM
jgi:hypothetical protein